MKSTRLIPLRYLAVGSLAFLLGRFTSPQPSPSQLESSDLHLGGVSVAPMDKSMVHRVVPDYSSPSTAVVLLERLWSEPAVPSRNRHLLGIIQDLARTDPIKAMELAQRAEGLSLREYLQSAVFLGWAEIDPEAAIQSVMEMLGGPPPSRSLLHAVVVGAANGEVPIGPRLRSLFEEDSPECIERGFIYFDTLTQNGEFHRAVENVLSLSHPKRVQWVERIFSQWAMHQPEAAVIFAVAFDDLETRDHALRASVASWSRQFPEDLALFASKIADGPLKEYAVGEAMRQWSEVDLSEATNWLMIQPSDRAFDSTRLEMVLALNRADEDTREAQLGLARMIKTRSIRSTALGRIAQEWSTVDPASAYAFAAREPDLSEPDRQDLIRSLPIP